MEHYEENPWIQLHREQFIFILQRIHQYNKLSCFNSILTPYTMRWLMAFT